MPRETLKALFPYVPDGWIYLGDTDHALKYAAAIFNDPSQHLQLQLQVEYYKDLYRERKGNPEGDLDELACIAFQGQFCRECIEEIQRLSESKTAAGTK